MYKKNKKVNAFGRATAWSLIIGIFGFAGSLLILGGNVDFAGYYAVRIGLVSGLIGYVGITTAYLIVGEF